MFFVRLFFRMVCAYSYIMRSVWNMTAVVRERCLGVGGRGAYPHLLPHATATRDRPCGRFLYYHNIQLLTYRFNLHESLSIRFCVSSSF